MFQKGHYYSITFGSRIQPISLIDSMVHYKPHNMPPITLINNLLFLEAAWMKIDGDLQLVKSTQKTNHC